jgi:hypothetical protein
MKTLLSKIDFYKSIVLLLLIIIAIWIWTIADDVSSIKYRMINNSSNDISWSLYDINSTLDNIENYSSSIDSWIYQLEKKIKNVDDQLWSIENNWIRIK